ncbi:MAG: histidinol dehydrogenase [Actinobacteria bacterium]|nr:MAG: histidinol dehydrogenase [Actinomycetota bacterium]
MLTRLDLRGDDADVRALLARADAGATPDDLESVRAVIADVRARGDAAVRELTERFDGCVVGDLRIPEDALMVALDAIDDELRDALTYARDAIRAYHEAQGSAGLVFERNGVHLREIVIPVARAGCYVPGGRAAYPSTVLMTAVPARVAGVPEIAMCVPPDRDGQVPTATLAAAALAGVDEVYRIGGAQAIAALAYGTETIRPVDVVVGPGNRYVALAKREVAGTVGVESFAGPSELVVIADETAPPDLVAADLLAQAEHGPDGAAVLVTWRDDVADAVDAALVQLLDGAGRRTDIEATLTTGGRTILVDHATQALTVANVIAPEHLELMTADPDALVLLVRNAGAVFCGPFAPAVVGDYVAGTNHVLPTARTARFASALRVDDFCKHVPVVDVDAETLSRLAPHIRALAAAEGLDAHGRAVALREGR